MNDPTAFPTAAALRARVADRLAAVGADRYSAALAVYHYARQSGEGAGLDELIEPMGRRCTRRTRTPKPGAPSSRPPATGAAAPGHPGAAGIRACGARKCKARGQVRKAFR